MFKPKTPISGRLENSSGERIRNPFGGRNRQLSHLFRMLELK